MKSGRFLLCVLTAWGTLSVAPATSALDFKGVTLGKPLLIIAERQVFGGLDCNPMGLEAADYAVLVADTQAVVPGARQICVASTSIAAVPADVTVVLGAARRVLRLSFQFAGDHYPQISRAMEAKWGTGIADVRGEHDRSMWWEFEDGAVVSLHEYPDQATQSSGVDAAAGVGLAEYSLPSLTPTGDL
jgi:hypothetical protein